MREKGKSLVYWYATLGADTADSHDLFVRKYTMTLISTVIAFVAVLWGSVYYWMGYILAGSIPFYYTAASLLTLLYFFSSKRFGVFCTSQLLLILFLPFLMQWSLGGFDKGSAVMIWAMCAPLGAMFFSESKRPVVWLLAFLGLTALSGVWDAALNAHSPPMDAGVKTLFYCLNMSAGTITAFILLWMFAGERETITKILNELNSEKTRFYQNISHELRTPLTLILNSLAHIQDDGVHDNYFAIARHNANRLLRLVNQLLEFQKLAAGKRLFHPVPLNAVHLLEQYTQHFAPLCEENGIRLVYTVNGLPHGPNTPAVGLYMDPDALEIIVSNYLSNALKHTPELGTISLRLDTRGNRVRLTVADTGPGIGADDRKNLFQLFSQLDSKTNRVFEGSGLGLALVKELAQAMRGCAGVGNEPDNGAAFWVDFPLCRGTLEQAQPPIKDWYIDSHACARSESVKLHANNASLRPKILIVDDNNDMLETIVAYLEHDYRVYSARSAAQAFEFAHAHEPDLMITDWMMPETTGIELIARIKQTKSFRTLPAILLTAKGDDASKLLALDAGADAFLSKPFDNKELCSTVRNLLKLKSLEKEQRERADELDKTKRLAEQANRAKTTLLANTTHELRTPINAIIGYCDLLLDALGEKSMHNELDDLNKIRGSALRLLDVINNLLDLAKIESGKMDLIAEEISINGILSSIVAELQPLFVEHENKVHLQLPDHDVEIRNDITKLRQIILNLLGNANKFTDHGRIDVYLQEQEASIQIHIVDTGIGMSENAMSRVFLPFNQADNSIMRRYGGTGLGLSICRHFARLMRGDITVASKEKAGTAFVLTLPYACDESPAQNVVIAQRQRNEKANRSF